MILAPMSLFESIGGRHRKGKSDIHSDSTIVKRVAIAKLVGDTDIGKDLKSKIEDLEALLRVKEADGLRSVFKNVHTGGRV